MCSALCLYSGACAVFLCVHVPFNTYIHTLSLSRSACKKKCRWMWLRRIFTGLKSYSAFYVCLHSSWSEEI